MADKEYIDREALLQRLECSPLFSNIRAGGFFIKNGVLDLVKRQPTADVAEVRNGEWKEYFMYDCWHYDCPFCDDGYATKGREKHPANYCSNCGAKLDGKEPDYG